MTNLDLTVLAAVLQCDPGQDWMLSGLCGQTDPDLWFPEQGGSTLPAVAVCRRCPVAVECLEHALRNHEGFGVWGGLTEPERRKVERSRYGRAVRGQIYDPPTPTRGGVTYGEFACPIAGCGYIASTAQGLGTHGRRHTCAEKASA